MLFFLTSQPLWLAAIIVVGVTTALATLGPIVVRRFVDLERLTSNNEIAGFKFATVGVLYAVLLAFAVIVVWEKYNEADVTVAQEAGAATTIYRLSHGMTDKPGAALRAAMTNYLNHAIDDDWPAMARGAAAVAARVALDNTYTALLTFQPASPRDTALFSEVLRQLDVVTQSRRIRLDMAEGVVPPVLWSVLFGGAILTIGFTFFFGTKNMRAQTMMTAMLSLLVFSELLIIVAIDRPFTGRVRVGPQPLAEVLADFSAETGAGTQPAESQP
jgi:hypothetical protein